MDIGLGTKRLTNRKRATPAKRTIKEVKSQVKPATLPTPVFGAPPDLQKEFSGLSADNSFGVSISRHEKDLISSKSLKQRKKLPRFEITDINYVVMSNEELEKIKPICKYGLHPFRKANYIMIPARGSQTMFLVSLCNPCNAMVGIRTHQA